VGIAIRTRESRSLECVLPIAASLGAGFFVYALLRLILNIDVFQWDLSAYYYGAEAFHQGANPYDRSVMESLSGKSVQHFVYPPLLLYPLQLLRLFAYQSVSYGWLAMKLVAVLLLWQTWRKHFVNKENEALLLFVSTLGLNSTLFKDIHGGNISVFEELVLWGAFGVLLQGRVMLFALILAVLAQVKLLPIFFAFLPLVFEKCRHWSAVALTLVAAIVIFSLNYLLQPELTYEFFRRASTLDQRAPYNISALAFIKDLATWLAVPEGGSGKTMVNIVFLLWLVILGCVSLWVTEGYRYRAPAPDSRLVICFYCIVYGLMIPRLMNYSTILLIVPIVYLIIKLQAKALRTVAYSLVILSCNLVTDILSIGQGYVPLFTVLGFWFLYVVHMLSCSKRIDNAAIQQHGAQTP